MYFLKAYKNGYWNVPVYYNLNQSCGRLSSSNFKKNLVTEIKIQEFEFEAPHTKVFEINRNFLAEMYFYILL